MASRSKNTTLGDWARAARKAKGYSSADDAARDADVPANWLRQVELGYYITPDAERMARLERLYGESAPEPVISPALSDEQRIAELVLEAYDRGFEKGLRVARGEG